MRLVKLVASVAATAAVIAGCSVAEGGQPTPTTGSSTQDETSGAPRVKDPLDTDRFLTEPCGVLGQPQLVDLSITQPGVPTTTGAVAENVGPSCTWQNSELANTIGVGFLTGNEKGLSDTYRGRDEFEYFEPIMVEGYPAVFAGDPDLRSSGTCVLVVGISDSLAIDATQQGDLDAQGSCDRAEQVATAALETLKGDG